MNIEKAEVLYSNPVQAFRGTDMNSLVDIARRYPRDITVIRKDLMAFCSDEATAKKCFYAKPVGDKGEIAEGPSIRLAEILKNCYTNIWTSVKEIPGTRTQKTITVQATAVDLEKNILHNVEITRSIWSDRQRRQYSSNMIDVTSRAGEAIAFRDAVFKVISLAVFEAEINEIKKIGTGQASKVPLLERVRQVIKLLQEEGVTKKRVLARLEVKKDQEITEEMLTLILGLGNAVADKETTYEEAFPLTNDAQDTAQVLTTDLKEVIADKIKQDATN